MAPSGGFSLPALRGVQAAREYYVVMFPLRLVPRLTTFDDESELSPELRAQRQLNKGRVPELVRYITANPENYVFSALTASVDGDVRFEPAQAGDESQTAGTLHVPMEARFIINDGQHRREAIKAALVKEPRLKDESIALVLFHDKGLARCQQMFADLNRHAIRPPTSLNVLFDQRDSVALLARKVAELPVLQGLVALDTGSLSKRSRALMTLSAIYTATRAFVGNVEGEAESDVEQRVLEFWSALIAVFPDWARVKRGEVCAGDVRASQLHTHAVMLHALALVGRAVVEEHGKVAPEHLKALADLSFQRDDPTWEGRAVIAGRVSKLDQSVRLAANLMKARIGLPLSPEEQRLEDHHRRGRLDVAA